MVHKFDIVIALDTCVDFLVRGDVEPQFGQVEKLVSDYDIELGGSGAIFACQCAKLGLNTAGIGVVGDDAFGRLVLKKLDESGVNSEEIRVDPYAKTGMGIALCKENDRAILTYLGTINGVRPEMVLKVLPHARHLHIASYYLMESMRTYWPDIVYRAKESGLTVSLDTNWDPAEKWDGFWAFSDCIDVFLPNENEVRGITGEEDVIRGALKLAAQFPLVVVKLGEKGAAAISGEKVWKVPARQVAVVDTVGAGDTFDAGFLYGWLSGHSVQTCLRLGCYCGTCNVMRQGGIAGQPRIRDIHIEGLL